MQMATLVEAFAEARKLAVKAETPIEQFMKTAEVIADRQAELDAANRSTDDERTTLHAYMEGLNGNINPEMTAGDICLSAGVRKNRGTAQFAAREKKRLLLTFQK
jgi:hypothetical protein